MPPKPRPHGKSRPPGPPKATDRRLLVLAALAAVALVAIVGVAVAVGVGGDSGVGDARPALEAAGCTLTAKPALRGDHSVTNPEGTSDEWETDPPTSGPHNAAAAVYGIYKEPVNQAQLVHNLEHGAIVVQYGDEVSASTIDELTRFAQAHQRGTILAPYAKLGSRIALGAWVVPNAEDPTEGTAYLATCSAFDDAAFEAFFDAYQFRGPERFPPDALLPGRT